MSCLQALTFWICNPKKCAFSVRLTKKNVFGFLVEKQAMRIALKTKIQCDTI